MKKLLNLLPDMIYKTFVSIYFLSNKLKILQLNSAKDKVVKVASVNIPEGIIKGTGGDGKGAFAYHVEDIDGLARILKTSWNKLHIKQRSVGLIVPEFSTFTKLFTVPKLPVSELDEAVRWQLQEIIPGDIKNMVIDWKIAARLDDGFQILVAAIQKDILKTYIASIERSGLFPLVVEMPSISLARVTGFEDVGKIIVYKESDYYLIVVANGEQIYAASVVEPDENIPATAVRMAAHYRQADIKKVQVGGVGIDDGIIAELKEKLGKEVVPIDLDVQGLENASVQEYLIPLSLQQKHSVEPSSPATINLLPPLLVAKYKSENTKMQVWGLSLIATLFIWICFFATLGSYLFLGQQKAQFESGNPTVNLYIQDRKQLVEKVESINELAGKVDEIREATVYPQTIFEIIDGAKGNLVSVNSYKMDLDKGAVIVKGQAADRPALIAFKNNLEANPNLGDIEIPISSLEVERDLDFQISFSYLPLTVTGKPR